MAEKFNFTKAAIDALSLPENGRAEYADTRQPGLRLRVTATGVKSFSLLKRIKGSHMERVTFDRYPTMTIEQARRKAAEILGKIAEGNNPAEAKRAIKEEPTFAELFISYGKLHGDKKRTWRDDQQRYRDYLDKPLGKIKVGAITKQMITRILEDMERDGKAGSTINGVRSLASSIFNQGPESGDNTHNPVRGTKMRKTVKRDRFIQVYEMPRFFDSLNDEPNPTIRDYLWISLLTGARRANVLAMRWSELNLDEGIWRVERTKNDDPQNVVLAPEAMALLLEIKKSADSQARFVFPGDGKHGHLVEPKRGWQRILDRDELTQLKERLEKAGKPLTAKVHPKTGQPVPELLDDELDRARLLAKSLKLNCEGARMGDLRIHDLRRTLGSYQAKIGASLLVIGKTLNHKSPLTTAIYARLDLDPVRTSVNAATAAMFAAGGLTDGSDKRAGQSSSAT
jgi:integrase